MPVGADTFSDAVRWRRSLPLAEEGLVKTKAIDRRG